MHMGSEVLAHTNAHCADACAVVAYLALFSNHCACQSEIVRMRYVCAVCAVFRRAQCALFRVCVRSCCVYGVFQEPGCVGGVRTYHLTLRRCLRLCYAAYS